ncbi:GrrA/OscA1 family cyclophane-containing rSAM-modified RiPP [Crocosphaera chwakensis]|nr:GrrA/OscA1 family cyclophane-containing rSAM-modified RiPP [Crocosphaera chwakensis]
MTTKITFMGFLLAVSTLSVSVATANSQQPINTKVSNLSNNIEYRLSRITKAIQQREIKISNQLENKNAIARGFANRSGGGGFVNRSPFRNGGGFYNRY